MYNILFNETGSDIEEKGHKRDVFSGLLTSVWGLSIKCQKCPSNKKTLALLVGIDEQYIFQDLTITKHLISHVKYKITAMREKAVCTHVQLYSYLAPDEITLTCL